MVNSCPRCGSEGDPLWNNSVVWMCGSRMLDSGEIVQTDECRLRTVERAVEDQEERINQLKAVVDEYENRFAITAQCLDRLQL